MTEAKCKEPTLNYESRCRLVVALLVGAVLLCFSPSTLATAAQSRSLDEVLATLGKGPTLGPASAPVTIIEFSDFQCGYCKKFWADTLPELKKSYFDKGTARFVFRHFAILGKHSEQAALAAECAAEQGKFWEYHDKLFANLGTAVFTEARLIEYARGLRLHEKNFRACLTTGKYKAKVERETVTAVNLGGRGTPMFLVNHWLLVGAQPFETFQKVIDKELSSAKVKAKTKSP